MNRNSKAYKKLCESKSKNERIRATWLETAYSVATKGKRSDCQVKHLAVVEASRPVYEGKEAVLASAPGTRDYWKESQALATLDKDVSNFSSAFRARENWKDSTRWQSVQNELGNAPDVRPLKSNSPGRVPGLSDIGWEGLAQIAARYDLDSQSD